MKTYSCYICDKTFKNSRSLGTHNYKFHSSTSTSSIPRSHLQGRYDASIQNEGSSSATTTSTDRVVIGDTLNELKAVMKSLKQQVDVQEEKVKEFDNQLFRRNSNRITEMESKIEKIKNALKEHNEHSFENMIHDTLEIQSLLRRDGMRAVKSKIRELKNATLAISEAFDFDWSQAQLLRNISNASFTEAKQFLKENVTTLKKIFSSLPKKSELEKIIRGEESEFGDEIEETDENSESEYDNEENSAETTLTDSEDSENHSDDENSSVDSENEEE